MPNQHTKPMKKEHRIYSEDFLFIMGTTIMAFLAVLVIIAVVGNHANCEMMVKAISNVSNSQVQGILANYVQMKC